MKLYLEPDRMRITGKGWEIRRRMRLMVREAGKNETLKHFLERRCRWI
jgi:hypothetical protein